MLLVFFFPPNCLLTASLGDSNAWRSLRVLFQIHCWRCHIYYLLLWNKAPQNLVVQNNYLLLYLPFPGMDLGFVTLMQSDSNWSHLKDSGTGNSTCFIPMLIAVWAFSWGSIYTWPLLVSPALSQHGSLSLTFYVAERGSKRTRQNLPVKS